MKPGNVKRALRIFFLLATAIVMAGAAHAGVRIGGSAFSANGQLARDYQYTGPCPVDLKFDWGVIAFEPSTVSYWFRRNDRGQSSASRTIGLPGGNRSIPILEQWRLGANTPQFFNYSGWVELNIESPNRISNRIRFTLHCQ